MRHQFLVDLLRLACFVPSDVFGDHDKTCWARHWHAKNCISRNWCCENNIHRMILAEERCGRIRESASSMLIFRVRHHKNLLSKQTDCDKVSMHDFFFNYDDAVTPMVSAGGCSS